jgi:hypothetical protein
MSHISNISIPIIQLDDHGLIVEHGPLSAAGAGIGLVFWAQSHFHYFIFFKTEIWYKLFPKKQISVLKKMK